MTLSLFVPSLKEGTDLRTDKRKLRAMFLLMVRIAGTSQELSCLRSKILLWCNTGAWQGTKERVFVLQCLAEGFHKWLLLPSLREGRKGHAGVSWKPAGLNRLWQLWLYALSWSVLCPSYAFWAQLVLPLPAVHIGVNRSITGCNFKAFSLPDIKTFCEMTTALSSCCTELQTTCGPKWNSASATDSHKYSSSWEWLQCQHCVWRAAVCN